MRPSAGVGLERCPKIAQSLAQQRPQLLQARQRGGHLPQLSHQALAGEQGFTSLRPNRRG
jgi:hypothetical protein